MKRKTFNELDIRELYAICKLRQDVFIVEQNSIYNDLDGLDQTSVHFLDINDNEEIIGYARYREVGKEHFKLERVVLREDSRGGGRGKTIIEQMLTDIRLTTPSAKITLSAQTNALKFYHSLGFQAVGGPYDDGGIEHITMTLKG
ncbi:MAG: GNAT family N-acetyltransferase [Paraglaciecola sp.]|uniref:GNAT family N-acetyltransferase n=1 Tax=Paraglaciecola sp. TaxID=1920173 RepID=UPI0032970DF0